MEVFFKSILLGLLFQDLGRQTFEGKLPKIYSWFHVSSEQPFKVCEQFCLRVARKKRVYAHMGDLRPYVTYVCVCLPFPGVLFREANFLAPSNGQSYLCFGESSLFLRALFIFNGKGVGNQPSEK